MQKRISIKETEEASGHISSTKSNQILSLKHNHETSHNKIMESSCSVKEPFSLLSPQVQRKKWHCMCKGLIASYFWMLISVNSNNKEVCRTRGTTSIGPAYHAWTLTKMLM